MRAAWLSLLVLSLGFALAGSAAAQDKDKKSSSKDKESASKKEDMKDESSKKSDKKSTSGDEKAEKAEKPKLKGQLPANYRKLSLTDEQVQKIYKLQAEFDKKKEALEEQLKQVKAEEKKEIEAVLTPGQRTRLKEILTEKDKDK